MLRNISWATIRVAIFQSLIFIKLTHKVSKMKIMDPLYEVLGSIVFVLFNCIIFVYLQPYSYWATSILFVVSCFIYLMALSRNHLIENVILSLTYYVTFWFITYAIYYLFNSWNKYVMPLPSFVLDYVATAIALIIIYLAVSKLMPIMIDYKDHDLSILQFLMLMIFGVTGFISLALFNNGFSIALGAMCSISILMLSLYIKKRNEYLEKQDKLVIV